MVLKWVLIFLEFVKEVHSLPPHTAFLKLVFAFIFLACVKRTVFSYLVMGDY